jgi:DNA polymerase III sliding clamp (beta) subunit (PCNA family)
MANFIALAGTMENAIAWKATPDKFIFAQDCLDAEGFEETLTDNPDEVEAAVELLEAVFEGLLTAEAKYTAIRKQAMQRRANEVKGA